MATVFHFSEGNEDKNLLGNKGANLVTMAGLNLPVPPGFVVSIEAYKEYKSSGTLPLEEMESAIEALERQTGKTLGQGMMVSVRSSAPVSMPGMMDTVLNVEDMPTLVSCLKQIFDSWDNPRAIEYRRMHGIPPDLGTAAVIQAMVMGNADERSGTGVVFTRDPSTGDPGLFGEYLAQAQGEDLVSGRRTPEPVATLRGQMPEVYARLVEMGRALERHFKDMQDIEFTVESGTLYMLQTRSGKRSGQAAVKAAVDMVKEGLISEIEALRRVTPRDLDSMLHKRIDLPRGTQRLTKGLGAAPGAATGRVVFDVDEALREAKKGESIILVRPDTSPDDIVGINAAQGVLTSRGGLTSHAAIVTRAMGKACVCGASDVKIDLAAELFTVGDKVVRKGDEVTLDGTTGDVYLGSLPLVEAVIQGELNQFLEWATRKKRLGVMANADSPEGIVVARRFGAEGVGLCRTERQFASPSSLALIREFILADTPEERSSALARLRTLQKDDFVSIFKAMEGLPITVRLLDMPLHEFLPHEQVKDPVIKRRIEELQEVNPMMGHRGVRLTVTYPELYQMQIDAIMEARSEVGANVSIMVPQVITRQELDWVKRMVQDPSVRVGCMMETVRACMRADSLAQAAEFFSFGTNDLTQATFSFSREDVEKKFLTTYLEVGILRDNPFEVIDIMGVGRLMEAAITMARREKPNLEIGVCGEHGGDPRSIQFFRKIGVDYVSVSPFRIPVAKLVAAQASIEEVDELEDFTRLQTEAPAV